MSERWLITGAGGQLGSVLLAKLDGCGVSAIGVVSPNGARPVLGAVRPCDLLDLDGAAALVRATRPTHIVHAAAMTAVAACFADPARAEAVNVGVTRQWVELAAEQGAGLIFTSTDLVFDGSRGHYREGDAATPGTVYGRSKVAAERVVLDYGRGAVVRLPLMYGLPAAPRVTTFVQQLRAIRDATRLTLFQDEFRSPLALEDASAALVRIARAGFAGLIHAGGPQRLSRLEMGRLTAAAMGMSGAAIEAISQRDLPASEPRPADVSLSSRRSEELFGAKPGRTMAEALPEIARRFQGGAEWAE